MGIEWYVRSSSILLVLVVLERVFMRKRGNLHLMLEPRG